MTQPRDGVLSTTRESLKGRRRTAPRALETSDVTRIRGLLAATIVGAAVLAVGVMFGAPGALAGGKPLSEPHRKAGLQCASCHLEGGAPADPEHPRAVAKEVCQGCHAGHGSTRAGHLALAAQGKLTCTTCHESHVHDSGAWLLADGGARRYGVGQGPVTLAARPQAAVPIIRAKACARCHDLAARRDPIRRCLLSGQEALGGERPTACFDEHRTPLSIAANDRWPLWERARALAATAPTQPKIGDAAPRDRSLLAWLLASLLAALTTGVVARFLHARRVAKAEQARAPVEAQLRAPELRRLPRINPTTCIGCHACVDACPYDVLEVRRYVARVVRPDDCCGLTLCEQRCPNGSLVVLDGEPLTDLPRIDDALQSLDRPGLYLAGDITGLPLIRNAINQGAHAIDAIARELGATRRDGDEVLDVLIVGAGPAGISACLAAKKHKLRYLAVDQDTVAASIRSFPRGKLVFDQPLGMPVIGDLWLRESTKEELLGKWLQILHREQLAVREGQRVVALRDVRGGPPLGHFEVDLVDREGRPSTLAARRVLLSFGRRGTPRKLDVDVPPEMESHVHYSLADARSFARARVLVVGLGDVAMETAIAIARQPGATVDVSYRGDTFKRGKRRNMDELQRLADAGRVTLRFGTEVERVEPGAALLRGPDGVVRVEADALFVMIGNLPPWSFLERLGVRRAGAAASEVA